MIRRETKDERRKSVILNASEGSRNCFTPYVIASNTNSERSVGAKVARQSQSGFTLMELLVYMAIVGIIVLVAFVALGVWAIVDFNGFFTAFHQAFFAQQGNWAFPYDSLLICALRQRPMGIPAKVGRKTS